MVNQKSACVGGCVVCSACRAGHATGACCFGALAAVSNGGRSLGKQGGSREAGACCAPIFWHPAMGVMLTAPCVSFSHGPGSCDRDFCAASPDRPHADDLATCGQALS